MIGLEEKNQSIRILDVIPAGMVFTVVHYRIEKAPMLGEMPRFDIALEGPLSQRWPLLDGFWLARSRERRLFFTPRS